MPPLSLSKTEVDSQQGMFLAAVQPQISKLSKVNLLQISKLSKVNLLQISTQFKVMLLHLMLILHVFLLRPN
jgi:hypothetical protein